MTKSSFYCCLMCSLGNRVTWESFGNVVYLHQYGNGEDSPKGENFESCLKAFQKRRRNMLVQNQRLSARVRWVIGGRWSQWSFRVGVRWGIKLLSKERRNVGNEESGYENSGKKILCSRNLSAFGEADIVAQLICPVLHRHHILKIF